MKREKEFSLNLIVTVEEIAEVLKVSTGTIYYWVSLDKIPHRKIGRHLRFNLKNVLDYFDLGDATLLIPKEESDGH